jgi:4-hydroxybenzoate polyprenyltransferase
MNMNQSAEKNNRACIHFFTGFVRIKGVLNWLAISFFGFLLGITSFDITSIIFPFCIFVISTFFILAFTFAVNNYYDIDTDKENPRRATLNAIASGTITKYTGKIFNLIFIIIPLVLTFLYTWTVFVFCAALIVWMWMYSAPPLRLKSRPGVDLLWHFIAFLALVLWGSYLAGSITLITIIAAVSIGLFGCFAQIDNHIQDYLFDKASGAKTFAVWIGLHNAHHGLIVTFILYLVSLLPLIILFSVSLPLTILLIGGGILGSILLIAIKKSTLTPALYTIIIFVGGAVYLNCLIYHLSSIL